MDWTVESARKAHCEGSIQDWVVAYLSIPDWQNLGLIRRIQSHSISWQEPQLMPIESLERTAGPGPHYRFPKDPDEWNREVRVIAESLDEPIELPPIICWLEDDGEINVADGNHRLDALTSLGHTHAWVLLHNGPLRSPEENEARARTLPG